jgi:hypothetical protein
MSIFIEAMEGFEETYPLLRVEDEIFRISDARKAFKTLWRLGMTKKGPEW